MSRGPKGILQTRDVRKIVPDPTQLGFGVGGGVPLGGIQVQVAEDDDVG